MEPLVKWEGPLLRSKEAGSPTRRPPLAPSTSSAGKAGSKNVSLRMGRIFALLLLLALCVRSARAQQDQSTWHLLIEPSFMNPEVSFPISGARHTVLVPGYLSDGEPQYFSKKDWTALGLTWDSFRLRAARNATEKKFHAALVRDAHKVVQYAAINSDDPLTDTMVLSPDFLKKFQDIFGPTLLVALPNRFTVYVFPGLASEYQSYAPMIIRNYQDSTYPVSKEIFEISENGIRAVGAFEEGPPDPTETDSTPVESGTLP